MTAWWTNGALAFDLESDGVDPEQARIITSCTGLILPGVRPDVRTWMAKPERPIPDEAAAVHGITTERAEKDGEPREAVVEEIAITLAKKTWATVPLVGHNIPYDLTLLDRELRRLGLGSIERDEATLAVRVVVRGEMIGTFWCIDTLVLDRGLDKFRPAPRDEHGNRIVDENGRKVGANQLTVAAAHYGVPIQGDAHSADADAMASARMAWAIARRCDLAVDDEGARHLRQVYGDRRTPREVVSAFAGIQHFSLAELHRWQEWKAREQGAGFADWVRKNPQDYPDTDPDTIRGDWPLIPYTEREDHA